MKKPSILTKTKSNVMSIQTITNLESFNDNNKEAMKSNDIT